MLCFVLLVSSHGGVLNCGHAVQHAKSLVLVYCFHVPCYMSALLLVCYSFVQQLSADHWTDSAVVTALVVSQPSPCVAMKCVAAPLLPYSSQVHRCHGRLLLPQASAQAVFPRAAGRKASPLPPHHHLPRTFAICEHNSPDQTLLRK